MYFEPTINHWLLENTRETYKITGMDLAKKVINEGVNTIPAGQVIVFDRPSFNDKIAFQTLEDIDLLSVRSSSLVGYEPGSVVSLSFKKPPRVTPTFVFRLCRFPTISEYTFYGRVNNL